MATVPLISDAEANPEVRAVFDDIRAVRGTDFINNFWRALAHDPATLNATWERLKVVMGPRDSDHLTADMIHLDVSVANGCAYCIHSHTAASRTKGQTPEQYGKLVPADEAFLVAKNLMDPTMLITNEKRENWRDNPENEEWEQVVGPVYKKSDGVDPAASFAIAELNGLDDVRERYGALNPGQIAMNIRNRLRPMWRSGNLKLES